MKISRRRLLETTALQGSAAAMMRASANAFAGGAPADAAAPVVNAGEHAWLTHDARFPIDPNVATCPSPLPSYEYSAGFLIEQMRRHGVGHVVISHVCYYGRDNRYTSHCVKQYPDRFAGVGLLVGYRLFPPSDPQNASRLERLMREDGLAGLRISPIFDPEVVWLNDPVCYPLWKKAEELGAVFNIFLQPHQIVQVADMARRFPGVNVVIDHLAKIDITAPDSAGFGALLDLARYPNVHIRTSIQTLSKTGKMPFRDVWPFLERLYDRFGPRRLVWSNFEEYLIMKELIPFFRPEDKEWILGRTAHRLYRFGKTVG
jgi:predicted TIM-barrel fold metal-dependent hydrolase